MSHRYHLLFRAQVGDQVLDLARIADLDVAIQYDSDIQQVEATLVGAVEGCTGAMLMSWRPLVGAVRPQPVATSEDPIGNRHEQEASAAAAAIARQALEQTLDKPKTLARKGGKPAPKKPAAAVPPAGPSKPPKGRRAA